jgi:hypothetical protein
MTLNLRKCKVTLPEGERNFGVDGVGQRHLKELTFGTRDADDLESLWKSVQLY